MKRILAIILVLLTVFSLCACGQKETAEEDDRPRRSHSLKTENEAPAQTPEPESEPEPEPTPRPTPPPSELTVGDVITLPFAEITIDSVGENDKFEVASRSGNVSSSVSFGAREGYTSLYVCGTIREEGEKHFSLDSVAGYAVVDGNKVFLNKSFGNASGAENATIFFFSYDLPKEELGSVGSCILYFGFDDQFEKLSGDYEACRYRYAVTVDPSAGPGTDAAPTFVTVESAFAIPTDADDLLAFAREAEENTRGYSVVSTKGVELELPKAAEYLDTPIVTQIKFSSNGAALIMPKPETGHGNLGSIEAGTKVTLIARCKNFYFFVADDGRMGWNGTKYFDI